MYTCRRFAVVGGGAPQRFTRSIHSWPTTAASASGRSSAATSFAPPHQNGGYPNSSHKYPTIPSSAASTTSSLSRRWLRTFPTSFVLPDPSALAVLPLVKIVATIGPKSEQLEPLKACVEAGLHCMRLNFSHATPEEVELRCANLASVVGSSATTATTTNVRPQDVISILLDTKGPELRTGKLANDESGTDTVELAAGDAITLHSSLSTLPNPAGGSTATDLWIDFPVLATVLQPHRTVLLDDGAIILTVESTDAARGTVSARVVNSGSLRSRAGVNLPLADTAQHLPALSAKDKADITYGMQTADIDFVAASFVQNAQHVIDIRQHLIDTAASLPEWRDKPLPWIISKIETASALVNFDEILDVSDGIMVARGDVRVC
jgi:pyruvate kinase